MYAALAIATGALTPRPAAALADDCRRGGEPTVVIAACSSVIASSRDARAVERAHNLRGLAYEATGQFQPAVDDASEVIRRDPRVAGFFDNRARAYRSLGRLDLALKDADTAVRMAPGHAFVFRGRGLVYSDLGRYDLAARDFGAGVAIDPADAGLRVERGRAVAMLGRPEDALADFSAALALRPGDAAALRERGLVRRRLGDDDGARDDLGAALAAVPGDRVAAGALLDLDRGAQAVRSPPPTSSQTVAQYNTTQPPAREPQRTMKDIEAEKSDAARGKAILKRARFDRASADAKQTLASADDFVRSNRNSPLLESHIEHIDRLREALRGTEPDPIEVETQALQADLQQDAIYVAFYAIQSKRRVDDDVRTLEDARQRLMMQRQFLFELARRDTTSPDLHTFVVLREEAQKAQASADLDHARVVVGRIEHVIDTTNHRGDFDVFMRDHGATLPD